MRTRALAVAALLLAPLLWLWPSVFGGRTFVPYDTAQFPPASLTLSPEQLAAARHGENTDVTELPPWFVPELEFAHAEVLRGRLPVWNPHARTGAPLHAHGLIGLGYPPNWIALLAPEPAKALVWVAWLNLALGGLLAFGLFRRVGIAALPAWFGALLFELSGPMAANAFFWMRLGSYVWLPGVLWAVHTLAHAPRLRARELAALGGAFAMTWLAGFPPFAATTTLLALAFAAWLVVARCSSRDGVRAAGAAAVRLAAGFALGGLLAMPQVLPSLQYFPHSARPTTPAWSDIAGQAYESYGLIGYVLPDALGHPSAKAEVPYGPQNVLGLSWNTRLDAKGKPALPNFNYTEYAVFVGQLGLLLALVGAVLGRGAHRGFAVAAWLACAGLALFVPGVRLAFHLPLVENVWPLRWLAPATLFVCWLAALGMQRLLAAGRTLPAAAAAVAVLGAVVLAVAAPRPAAAHAHDASATVHRLAAKYACTPADVVNHVQGVPPAPSDRFTAAFDRLATDGRRAALWLALAAALLGGFAVARDERRRRWLAVGAGALAAIQLGEHGGTITRGSLLATPTDTAVHAFLRERAAASASTGGFTIARGAPGEALPVQLPPGQLLDPGIRDLNFYSHLDGRSHQPLQRLLGGELGERVAGKGYLSSALPDTVPARDGAPALHPFEHPLLDLFGVRYVLSVGERPLPHAGTPVVIPGAPRRFHVQERATALPRGFAVGAVVPHANDDEVVAAMLDRGFAPRARAHALAEDAPSPLPPAVPAGTPARAVTFALDAPAHVIVDVAAGAQPWLLLTDTHLPGWTATVGGEVTPIVRADHSFRLVRVPERACRVDFRYHAPGLAAGCALAAFATLAWLVFAVATRARSRAAR